MIDHPLPRTSNSNRYESAFYEFRLVCSKPRGYAASPPVLRPTRRFLYRCRRSPSRLPFPIVPGAHFCPALDLEGTLGVIEHTLARGPDAIIEVIKDRETLRSEIDWEVLAAQKWNAPAAAC